MSLVMLKVFIFMYTKNVFKDNYWKLTFRCFFLEFDWSKKHTNIQYIGSFLWQLKIKNCFFFMEIHHHEPKFSSKSLYKIFDETALIFLNGANWRISFKFQGCKVFEEWLYKFKTFDFVSNMLYLDIIYYHL